MTKLSTTLPQVPNSGILTSEGNDKETDIQTLWDSISPVKALAQRLGVGDIELGVSIYTQNRSYTGLSKKSYQKRHACLVSELFSSTLSVNVTQSYGREMSHALGYGHTHRTDFNDREVEYAAIEVQRRDECFQVPNSGSPVQQKNEKSCFYSSLMMYLPPD